MAYTNITNLRKYMPPETIRQLTDDSGSGVIDTDIVDEMIDQAQKFIDGFLQGRYPADMDDADVPAMITDICTKLTAYNLYRRKLQLTLPETISKDYSLCVKTLNKIQEGKISPFPTANEPAVIVGNKVATDRDYTSTVWDTY
jgi:phage gp36-like protein